MGTVVWTMVGWMVSVKWVRRLWCTKEIRQLTSLDNGLDGLVNVVVDVLASDDGCDGVSVCGLANNTLILELSSLTCETCLDLSSIAMVELAGLYGDEVVCVLLREDLTVGDGLN